MQAPGYAKRASGQSVLDPYNEQLASWLKGDSLGGKLDRRSDLALFQPIRAIGHMQDSMVERVTRTPREQSVHTILASGVATRQPGHRRLDRVPQQPAPALDSGDESVG